MDFLDQEAVSEDNKVFNGPYSEFLGLGNNKEKATAQNGYEEDLLNRYPFSMDCAEQTKAVNAMLSESAITLELRNGAKKNSNYRNDLTGKLRAFDSYIPAAIEFRDTISCVVPATPPPPPTSPVTPPPVTPGTPANPGTSGSGDAVLGSATLPANNLANTAAAQAGTLLSKPMSNTLKYSLIGLGALIVIVGGIAIIKRN